MPRINTAMEDSGKLKIAFIVSLFPSLSETFILNQIIGLINLGHEVDIITGQLSSLSKIHPEIIDYKLLNRTYCYEIPHKRLERLLKALKIIFTHSYSFPFCIFKSFNIFKYKIIYNCFNNLFYVEPFLKKKYDIIHCHFGPNGLLGIRLKNLGIPGKYITSFHGYDVNSFVNRHGKDVYQELFREIDLCTVNSNFVAKKLGLLGCDPQKVIKLPVGLDTNKIIFKERKIDKEGKIKILTVARLVEEKGLKYSILAVAKLKKKYPNIYYQIAGDGPLRKYLQSLVNDLKANEYIKILGWKTTDEVRSLYERAHIFILPSIRSENGNEEAQGLVLQEAQAAGLPVISTLIGGIPEGVLDGETGFLVPEKDEDSLAERLEYLITHPELWPEMGRKGRKFVEENFDIKKLNQRLVDIYRSLLQN